MKRRDMMMVMMMMRRAWTHWKGQWKNSVCTVVCTRVEKLAGQAGNLDPELFCTCRGEGSRAFPNP